MDTVPRSSPYPQDIQPIFDAIDDAPLLAQLDDYRWTGRKGYNPQSMWRAILVKYLLRLRYVRDLIAQLKASRPLRRLCGFREAVPSESSFSRFLRRLEQHNDLVEQALNAAANSVGDVLAELKADGLLPDKAPDPGRAVAIDSTDIPAYGNPRRKVLADPDARWGYRTPKSGIKDAGPELFYGYKLHAVCDAYYGTPLAWDLLPANVGDSPQLPPLADQLTANFPDLSPRYFLADRGYDALTNYQYLDRRRILAVIHIRNTDKDGPYSTKGRPSCLGQQEMEYVRTDKGKGHLFRCPEGGCHLKDQSPWLGQRCPSEHYEDWKGDRLRKVGRLPRAGRLWRRMYRRRPIVERMFSSLKRSRTLAEHSCLDIRRMRLHVSLSLLTYTGSMLARLLAGDYQGMLDMAVRRPSDTWARAA